MDDFTPYLAFGSLVVTLTTLTGDIDDKKWKSVRTQVYAYVIGVVVTLLAAATTFASGVPTFGDKSLEAASILDQVFIGLTTAGVAGVFWKTKKAIDNRDSDGSGK